ncbi:MAG: hypothetical protein L6265_00055 [Thermoplasmatales archaeon]|nr:hypothetical protein [Thermoplasmatales archaeon]
MKYKIIVLSIITIMITFVVLSFLSYAMPLSFKQSKQISYEQAEEDTALQKMDSDNDGLSDIAENNVYGTNFTNPDSDDDGMPDGWEIQYRVWSNVTGGWTLNPNNASDKSEDPDRDGLTNIEEYYYSTNPNNPDTDFDGMPDGWEAYYSLNPSNATDRYNDPDKDGLTNLEEYMNNTSPVSNDSDNDGLSDWDEIYIYNTDPSSWDSDNDGMPDGWEIAHAMNPNNSTDAGEDLDNDALINLGEYRAGTNPHSPDTDSDGMPDGWEVKHGLNPFVNDSEEDLDGDNLTNYEEYIYNANPNDADTDGDGLNDYEEVKTYHTNPRSMDSDNDDITDFDEVNTYFNNSAVDWNYDGKIENYTNPNNPDSDDDGLTDYDEIFIYGTNPLNNDFDLDGLKDGDEINKYHTNPVNPDTDNDGLIDGEEVHPVRYDQNGTIRYQGATDPNNPDTDNDSMPDGWEYDNGLWVDGKWTLDPTDPTDKYDDPDRDGLENYKEYSWDADPNNPDTDSDGMPDGWEDKYTKWDESIEAYNINPKINDAFEDADNDTVINLKEYLYNTNPNKKDTDNDGIPDWWEIYYGDHDGDGLPNWFEDRYGLPGNWSSYWNASTGWKTFEGFSPWNTDTNGNNISDADEDPDGDGYTNIQEYQEHTDPTDPESYPKGVGVNKNNIDFIVEKTLYKTYRRDKNGKMGI